MSPEYYSAILYMPRLPDEPKQDSDDHSPGEFWESEPYPADEAEKLHEQR
jgi:hypothetical protein